LFSLFASSAIVLDAAGLFGVLATAVSQRTHEIGVRMALGATEFAVVRLVLRQVLGAAMAGALVGLALTAGAGRF
jgi:putative ABC transport system permease protein